MKTKVFNFVKPSFTATLNSNYLSKLISDTLKCPLVWDKDTCSEPLDLLIVVNGPYAFSGGLEYLAKAARQAKRVVWVQHDYTVVPPKPTSKGQSPFRACWRLRQKAGLPDMDYWTTVQQYADMTPLSSYVNWNAMAYHPLTLEEMGKHRSRASKDLLYYGAYRLGRVPYFHRYFDDAPVPVTISGERPQWKENWGTLSNVNIIKAIPRPTFYQELAHHGLGLYIEDKKSHTLFCSPASRFYEMLSAGLPMVFQPESVPMLKQAGIDATPYVIESPQDLVTFMRKKNQISAEQQTNWSSDYHGALVKSIKKAYARQVSALS